MRIHTFCCMGPIMMILGQSARDSTKITSICLIFDSTRLLHPLIKSIVFFFAAWADKRNMPSRIKDLKSRDGLE